MIPKQRLGPAWRRRLKRIRSGMQFRFLGPGRVPSVRGEIRLLLAVRNEALRLPFMLDYAFGLGVDRVIAIDNGSTDGTLDVLRSRGNVHVISTRETYQRHGTWFDVLLNRFGEGHWCWMADADELLAFPHSDTRDLRSLTSYFDAMGVTAMSTLLVDFYAKDATSRIAYRAGDDFRSVLPWFDPPSYGRMPFRFERCETDLNYRFTGGVRLRVFGQDICCTNFPLVKFSPGMFLTMGRHSVEGARISQVRGAILHYKFLGDFNARAMLEAQRGEHYNGAAEYKAYADRIRETGDVSFWFPQSIRYENPGQLVRLGIMASDAGWDSWAPDRTNTRGAAG